MRKLAKDLDILLIILLSLVIIGSPDAWERGHITLLRMLLQIAIAAAGIMLAHRPGVFRGLEYILRRPLGAAPRRQLQRGRAA